ncbi:MAG: hypothetical protein M1837_001603 [Sclerophora amabilis]|nr:MAG: hypothetical protein M1837_001603 [Sclerophora amabilis]
MLAIAQGAIANIPGEAKASSDAEAVQGLTIIPNAENSTGTGKDPAVPVPGPGRNLSIMLDGNLIEIKDQIQMYASNQLISHPLVSPVLQPSLGGLPPLLILTGGGEMLRDEQIYLAHKAANPTKYPPGDMYLDDEPNSRDIVGRWKGTDVQLQVWDDCCHVTPTLSFTRPAKFMYRSVAQFGAWALARAQKTQIEIMDDDSVSVISSDSDNDESSDEFPVKDAKLAESIGDETSRQVGKAGEPLPPFRNHMIRERVDRHGAIYPLPPASSLPALQVPPNEIGVIKQGPVRKWIAAKKEWDLKFARQKRAVQKQRAKEMAAGYQTFGDDDVPPPSALAGRRRADMPKERKKAKSWGMSLWSVWGSSHDERTLEREEKADKGPETTTAVPPDGSNARSKHQKSKFDAAAASRSRSRRRPVIDAGQTSGENDEDDVDENTTAADLLARKGESDNASNLLSPTAAASGPKNTQHQQHGITTGKGGGPVPTSVSGRPHNGTIAYPFKLAHDIDGNASTMTLTSVAGVVTPKADDAAPGGEDQKKIFWSDDTHRGGAPSTVGDVKRPEPERFVTASDGVDVARSQEGEPAK